MNSVQKASRDVLIALVIDAGRGDGDLPDITDLRQRYHIKMSDQLLSASIEPWIDAGFLIDAGSHDGPAAGINPTRFGSALSQVLDFLRATQFKVNWQKEEILTDADPSLEIPCPDGWKIFHFENEQNRDADQNSSNADVDSSKWTGLPSNFQLTQEIQKRLVSDLDRAEATLDGVTISQHERSQARAYIIAMRVLAEAPEPQADLIWELLGRANQISGIASLFVSIIALFATVAH